jgi:hypothetical protein
MESDEVPRWTKVEEGMKALATGRRMAADNIFIFGILL